VIIPEDEWIRMDNGLEGLEGGGATSDWERMLVSSGSLPSKLLVEVVDPVVTVVLVMKGSASEGPEGWCCRMERRAARVAASALLRRDVKSMVMLAGGLVPVGVVCMLLGRGEPVPVRAMVFVELGRRPGPGGGIVGVMLGWGAPVLVRAVLCCWGAGFMVGMVWEGRREGWEGQQGDDS
jgi:hypothetical protein